MLVETPNLEELIQEIEKLKDIDQIITLVKQQAFARGF
jgi:hypothetical protein